MFKDLGLPSGRGYYAFNGNHSIFYFNNRGFMICVDTNTLEILIKKDMRAKPIKQIAFIPERDELCVLSMESISLLDAKNLNIKQSFDFPKQSAIQDYINSKTGEVFWKKGDPIFLTPSGVTYRKLTNELIVTFDYSPDMLLINYDSKKHRLVNFTEKSITLGQPVYFDEQHLLIGGKYIYDFSRKSTKQITGAENSMVLDSLLIY